MNIKNNYHIYAAITVTFWALSYVFSRIAMAYFTPYSLACLRYIVAAVAMIFVVLIKKVKPPKLKDYPLFVLGGAAGFFVYAMAFNKGTQLVPSATSSVVIAMVPVITAFCALFIFKEKLANYQWVAIGIEFIGIIVLALWGGTFEINEGIIWLLVAALSLSCYNLVQRKLTKMYEPLTSTSYCIFAGTLLLLVFLPQASGEFVKAPTSSYIYILCLGVLSSAVAYVFWAKAFSVAKNTSDVSNYMFITPFITAVLGFIFENELPDLKTICGGGIIMIGVILFFKNNIFKKKFQG